MVLYAIVDIAQDGPDAVLLLHVELEIADHAEALDEAGDGLVEPPEAGAAHQGVLVLQVGGGLLVALLGGALALGGAARGVGRVVVEQAAVGVHEALEVLLAHLVLDEVHLGEHVDVRDLEHDHGGHGGQGAGEELGAVDDEGGLEQVGGAEADVEGAGAREEAHERGEDGHVRVQLDLARHVEDDEVLLGQRVEGVGEEVEVLHEELEAVDEPAVGAEPHLLHDVLERDEVLDVEVGRVLERLGRRVEVDVEGGPPVELKVCDEGRAERGLWKFMGMSSQLNVIG